LFFWKYIFFIPASKNFESLIQRGLSENLNCKVAVVNQHFVENHFLFITMQILHYDSFNSLVFHIKKKSRPEAALHD